MKRVHDRHRVRQRLRGRTPVAGEPVHRHGLDTGPKLRGLGLQPGGEHRLRPPRDHVQQTGWARAVTHGGEVDDHGDEPCAVAGVTPAMLIDPQDPHPLQPPWVLDQQRPTGCEDGVVGGVPRRPQPVGDPGDRHAVDDHGLQRPQHRRPAQLRPGLSSRGRVLAPHVPTARAPVAADRDVQDRRAPAHRHVRQPAQHRVPRHPELPAPGAPARPLGHVTGLHHPARQHRVIGADLLTGHGQPQPIEQAERIEIRTVESRVIHVEVFLVAGVRTAIIGGPRPLPPHQHTTRDNTLVCEEPNCIAAR